MKEQYLRLEFESISSIPQGSNEVRLYHDEILDCDRVGKRFDLGLVDESVLPEASTLQSIRHRNVLEVVSAAIVEGYDDPLMRVIEIITPYYPKGSITDALLRGERFSGPDALFVIGNALRGLRELHSVHRILHRDLKSGNILLADPPVYALIADIGVAGRMDDDGYTSAVQNPTLYSPPELLTSGKLNAASDLYSFGHIMTELLGGPFPYERYSRNQVIESLSSGTNPISEEDAMLPVWAPKRLKKIHAKVTNPDPSKRYQSARDLSHDLENVKLADWREVEPLVWSVSPTATAPPLYQVRAQQIHTDYLLSLKKHSGSTLRRPSSIQDIRVQSLRHKDAAEFFDMANSLAAN